MAEVIGVAEAKRRFSELIDRVQRGERVVVARRGKPVLALVPPGPEAEEEPTEYLGLLAFAGILEAWPEFDEIMQEVVASRRHARDREVPYFDDWE